MIQAHIFFFYLTLESSTLFYTKMQKPLKRRVFNNHEVRNQNNFSIRQSQMGIFFLKTYYSKRSPVDLSVTQFIKRCLKEISYFLFFFNTTRIALETRARLLITQQLFSSVNNLNLMQGEALKGCFSYLQSPYYSHFLRMLIKIKASGFYFVQKACFVPRTYVCFYLLAFPQLPSDIKEHKKTAYTTTYTFNVVKCLNITMKYTFTNILRSILVNLARC